MNINRLHIDERFQGADKINELSEKNQQQQIDDITSHNTSVGETLNEKEKIDMKIEIGM